MIPVYFQIPFVDKSNSNLDIPITWQIPTIVFLTLVFDSKVVSRAFTTYLVLGLFIFPVFNQGGSLGYLLTPNFGYLIGSYPLINSIGNLNKRDKFTIRNFLINGFFGIFAMHLTGILYNFIQLMIYDQFYIFLYNLGKYSVGKIGYHLIMLIPLILFIKPIRNLKYNKK